MSYAIIVISYRFNTLKLKDLLETASNVSSFRLKLFPLRNCLKKYPTEKEKDRERGDILRVRCRNLLGE